VSLKELTYDHHRNAERQKFVKTLMGGNIDPKVYAEFLYNQYVAYNILEVCAMAEGVLNDLPDIRRAPKILEDFQELWGKDAEPPKPKPSIQKYVDHIMSIKEDPEKLMAHIYTRHMGDLSGGQMIKKRIPGEGRLYMFEDPDNLKTAIRSKLNDNMADEAKICFEYATELFKEMHNETE
jgi:heme oxygenase|tara:strand:- start:1099 stop:1638 length:540 start_codon:yes stop_codon:yes gene_type:complete